MFTFEDLAKVDATAIQTILRGADKQKIPLALKGASETLRELFFSNMSERAAKILKEDMQSMGPVRLKDVEEAQSYLVTLAKDLAARAVVAVHEQHGPDFRFPFPLRTAGEQRIDAEGTGERGRS